MIIVEIKGGLGNQLFQYAAAKAVARNYSSKLGMDKSSFEVNSYTKRNLSILNLNLKTNLKTRNYLKKIKYLRKLPFLSKITINEIMETKQNELKYDPLYYNASKINILSGYFQSYKYFENIREILLEEFQPLQKSALVNGYSDLIKSKQSSISLHVRRGDYVKLGWDLSVNYYLNALSEMIKLMNFNNNKISLFIFSDDINWCQDNLIKNDFKEVNITLINDKELKDYEELYLMSLCENNIISNSTFSWWGAWLNRNDEKIVIAPDKWIEEKTTTEFNIIPDEWIVIKENN